MFSPLLLCALSLTAQAQADAGPRPDPLAPLQFLVGKWEGTASGEPGKGVTKREYALDLKGRFVVARNRSVYEPRKPGGPSEVHEDLGIFSYDKAQKRIVLRQFHVEGFVNEYVVESITPDGATLTFVTVRIENIPAGWRAREVYQRLSADEVVETFSLAPPGKDFEPYSVTRLARKK